MRQIKCYDQSIQKLNTKSDVEQVIFDKISLFIVCFKLFYQQKYKMDRLFLIDNKENEFQASENQRRYTYRDRRSFKQNNSSKTILKSHPLKEPDMNINYDLYEKSPEVKPFALNTNVVNSKSQIMLEDRQCQDIDISNFGQDIPIRQKYDRSKYLKRTQLKNESIIQTSVLEISDNELSGLYKPNQKKNSYNSKHIEFCSKVNNLDKLNNRLSSLLDYVNGYSKRPQKQKNINLTPNSKIQSYKKDRSSNKLAMVSPYERKKRMDYSPYKNQFKRQQKSNNRNVSPSPINSKTTKRIAQRKQRLLRLSNQNQQKTPIIQKKLQCKRQKSYSKMIDQKYSPRYSPRYNPKYEVQKQIKDISEDEKKYQKSILYENDKAFRAQPDFNATTELQFFYDSLKRRDEKIINFNNALNQRYPENRQLDRRSLMSSIKNSDGNDQGFKKRDKSAFITQDEVQIYKDIIQNNRGQTTKSMIKNKQNYLQAKHRRNHTPLSRREQLLKELKTSASVQLEAFNHESRQYLQSITSQLNIGTRQESNLNFQKLNINSRSNEKLLNKTSSLQASKLNEQINNIKQELKQSKQHKYFLRQRYSGLLNDQTPRNQSINKNNSQFNIESKKSNEVEEKKNMQQDNFDRFNSEKNCKVVKQSQNGKSQKEQDQKIQLQITQSQDRQAIYNSQHRSLNQQSQHIRQDRSVNISRVQSISKKRNNSIKRTQFKDQPLQDFMRDVKNGPKAAKNSQFENMKHKIKEEPKSPLIPKNRLLDQQLVPAHKAETTKLGMILGQKIEIDLQLRDVREIFMSVETQQSKWQILADYLKNELHLQKSTQYWKQLLNISSQQHNPFSKTINNSKYCLQTVMKQLCSKLKNSFNFYEQNIHHKFSEPTLKKQRFSFKDLDLSGKGYLSMQDLICFVNLHSGKFYRNRDIIFLVKSILMSESYLWKNQNKKMDSMKIEFSDMWNQITRKD